MYLINRAVAILKPKQPLLDWLASLPDPTTLTIEQVRQDCTALLIPDCDRLEEAVVYIEQIYRDVFEMELEDWWRDRRLWPAKRDYSTFAEWFEIEIFSMVMDTVEDAIVEEEY